MVIYLPVTSRPFMSLQKEVRVAPLQSEFCTKNFFEQRNFLRKILRKFPRNFRTCILWVRKISQNSHQMSRQISLPEIKKNHRRASAGAQGEKEAVSSPCHFATTHLTACILKHFHPLTSRPMKRGTLSQRPTISERVNQRRRDDTRNNICGL